MPNNVHEKEQYDVHEKEQFASIDGILQVLIKNNCNNYGDMSIIFHALMQNYYTLGYDKCLYKGKFYDSINDLPEEGKEVYKYILGLFEKSMMKSYYK